jgi:MoaA/NifB/PqqE/SkfB family radical SAM enzyme
MKKIKIDNPVSILVNNTCNLTCSLCAGLAMYDFVGTFKWNDHKDRYTKWSEIAEFNELSLCGGEPYLHPELELWFDEIRKLWPNTYLEIMTNGTRMSTRINLSRKFVQDGNACIVVSCHDEKEYEKIKKEIEDTLSPWQAILKTIESNTHWKTTEYYLDNRLVIKYQLVTTMIVPYHKTVENGTVYFEMGGDQEQSHDKCDWKTSYTFQHGLLYKCPAVTNYSEAKLQANYEPEARKILETYQGCDPFDNIKNVKKFVDDLTKSINVCKLCAFDKPHRTDPFIRPIDLDVTRKTKFRQIKVKQI